METLNTLSEREFNAGMAEVIKYSPIADSKFLDYLEKNKEKIRNKDTECMKYIIKRCCEIKADVVSKDEKESGLREILNFGHTIGHAVETKMDFALLHGECVALGMKAVFEICLKRGTVTQNEYDRFISLLEYFSLSLKTENITAEEVYRQMFLDKKVQKNTIRFVLLEKFGLPFSTTDVSKDEIFDALGVILG